MSDYDFLLWIFNVAITIVVAIVLGVLSLIFWLFGWQGVIVTIAFIGIFVVRGDYKRR